ncbi:methionyl-tRNA synthetase-like protein [Patellaria atrata CBS 101060]|uniref:Probable methionine--tRNA ligase, mitochondrial n=1 Tax=Patellaria atrata CBS 101060 TaxID=1346257 RepID=A0A9P4SJE5_9PEZI|nr:methionyl-tRNA synthetase-like protein [Patellaria atrata CBS 101060]
MRMRLTIFNSKFSTAIRPSASAWVCPSCILRSAPRRRIANVATRDKPYYLSTPIFYVNAAPHVGHLYTMVLADIIKRWQILQGKKVILSTGTDEHGMKIQQAAWKAGNDPKSFCDEGADVFKTLAARADVSHDHFVRTTDANHKEAVQYAWRLLRDRGYIYASKHEGWYSVSDETFYPQSGVHLVLEPSTGRKMMASIETGKEVEWTSETNYHFRLSAFKSQLLDFYDQNPGWVIPNTRMQDVVQQVLQGLEDLSVSRPTERLSWGIRVPDDESQTIYVWLDALLNYATIIGYPWTPGYERLAGWPVDLHVIGKDIVRFHCIYWPAFLMALDLPLPNRVLTTAHWTLGRQKMAKSTGNVVNPFFAIDRFGVDAMRYYLAHDGAITDDSDYSNEYIIERYKKGLQNGLGNLASRVLRGKSWNVQESIQTTRYRIINDDPPGEFSRKQWALLRDLPNTVKTHMEECQVGQALKVVMDAVYQGNKYLHHAAPWYHVPPSPTHNPNTHMNVPPEFKQSPEDAEYVNTCIFICAETLRLVGILLQPYMPTKSNQLLDMLGVDTTRRAFEYAHVGADGDYGQPNVDLGKGHKGALFPPLSSES